MKVKDIVYARKVVRAIQAKNRREDKLEPRTKKKVKRKTLSTLMVFWLITLSFIALVLWGALFFLFEFPPTAFFVPLGILLFFLVTIVLITKVNSFMKPQNLRGSSVTQNQNYRDSQYVPPYQNTHVVVHSGGFSGCQVLIIVVLSIIAFVVCSCVGLSVIAFLGQPPPG